MLAFDPFCSERLLDLSIFQTLGSAYVSPFLCLKEACFRTWTGRVARYGIVCGQVWK